MMHPISMVNTVGMVKAVGDSVSESIGMVNTIGDPIGKPISMVNVIAILKGLGLLQDLREPLTLGVCMEPEVKEQDKEHQAIDGNNVNKDWELVGAFLHEEVLATVDSHHHKLDLRREG